MSDWKGTGAPAVPAGPTAATVTGLRYPAVPLARYAERIGYRDCAFWGVRHASDEDWECRRVWSKAQRDMVEWALRQAQELIEAEVGYFLVPSWVEDERHPYGDPLLLTWGYAIAGGVRSDVLVGNSVAPNYSADPATVTVPLGATYSAADLRIYHEDTDIEVTPTGYTVSGGNVIFTVPLCRLVAPAYADNPSDGWDHAGSATWRAAAVDVRAVTNDTSTQGTLIWRHECTALCAQRGCSDYRRTACVYVRNGRLGIVDLTRADYAAGTWTPTALCSGDCRGLPQWAEVSYYSGLPALSRQAEDAIIRLAHTLLPEEPCGCEVTQRLWQRDHNVPQALTPERANCPWGPSDGAWYAWKQAQTMKLVRGGVL